MVTLASLNILFIVIIVLLVRRHKNMAKELHRQDQLKPGDISKNLFSAPPPRNNSEASSVQAPLLYTSDSDVSSVQLQSHSDSSYSSEMSSMTYRPSPQPSYENPPTRATQSPVQSQDHSAKMPIPCNQAPCSPLQIYQAQTGHSHPDQSLTHMEHPEQVEPFSSDRGISKPLNCSYNAAETSSPPLPCQSDVKATPISTTMQRSEMPASSPFPTPPPSHLLHEGQKAPNSNTLMRRGIGGRETPL